MKGIYKALVILGCILLIGWDNIHCKHKVKECVINSNGSDADCDSCYYAVYGYYPEEVGM